MKRNPPCYQCEERQLGCHGKCERYGEFHAKRRKLSEDRLEDKKIGDVQYYGMGKRTKPIGLRSYGGKTDGRRT